jgi:NADH/NAD ratio-sensing transcriptional regulator Rex
MGRAFRLFDMEAFMSDITKGKRVSAKEAAAILGVPYANISRIDRPCTIIQRFRLGHKTYVYDIDSLYRFLASCQSKPSPKTVVVATGGRSSASSRVSASVKPSSSLRDFLLGKQTS